VATNQAGHLPRTFHPLTRWAAFAGIALLVLRKLVFAAFPDARPTSAWRPEFWWAGLLTTAFFELILFVLLLGVPVCIYRFRLRTGNINGRELLIDCAAAVSLYLTALFLL